MIPDVCVHDISLKSVIHKFYHKFYIHLEETTELTVCKVKSDIIHVIVL